MGDLSKNFSRSEFLCPDCSRCEVLDSRLIAALQRLRDAVGRPLNIVSGWRCCEKNRAVGGVRFSQHLYGRAADIPGGYATAKQCHAAGFIGVGLRAGRVIHVDVTPGRRPFTFTE